MTCLCLDAKRPGGRAPALSPSFRLCINCQRTRPWPGSEAAPLSKPPLCPTLSLLGEGSELKRLPIYGERLAGACTPDRVAHSITGLPGRQEARPLLLVCTRRRRSGTRGWRVGTRRRRVGTAGWSVGTAGRRVGTSGRSPRTPRRRVGRRRHRSCGSGRRVGRRGWRVGRSGWSVGTPCSRSGMGGWRVGGAGRSVGAARVL